MCSSRVFCRINKWNTNRVLSSWCVLRNSVLCGQVTDFLLLVMFRDQISGIWLPRGQRGGDGDAPQGLPMPGKN